MLIALTPAYPVANLTVDVVLSATLTEIAQLPNGEELRKQLRLTATPPMDLSALSQTVPHLSVKPMPTVLEPEKLALSPNKNVLNACMIPTVEVKPQPVQPTLKSAYSASNLSTAQESLLMLQMVVPLLCVMPPQISVSSSTRLLVLPPRSWCF